MGNCVPLLMHEKKVILCFTKKEYPEQKFWKIRVNDDSGRSLHTFDYLEIIHKHTHLFCIITTDL